MSTKTVRAIRSFRGNYFFLSNFYDVLRYDGRHIELEGLRFPSSEHAYQAMKTLDPDRRVAFQHYIEAKTAKQMGQRLKLREDWEDVKIDMMRTILAQKFAAGTELARKLLETGEAHLEEGNRHGDVFWGTVDGVGENWLGRLLMERRATLRRIK
jgi:ribA/ribD-fused uncharacterized protein